MRRNLEVFVRFSTNCSNLTNMWEITSFVPSCLNTREYRDGFWSNLIPETAGCIHFYIFQCQRSVISEICLCVSSWYSFYLQSKVANKTYLYNWDKKCWKDFDWVCVFSQRYLQTTCSCIQLCWDLTSWKCIFTRILMFTGNNFALKNFQKSVPCLN